MVARERHLRAGVEAASARGDHDVLQEHPVVEPAADLENAVDGEDQAHRRIEKQVVAPLLGAHFLLLAPGNAEQAV